MQMTNENTQTNITNTNEMLRTKGVAAVHADFSQVTIFRYLTALENMHPHNPYNSPVDFQALAAKNVEFRGQCVLMPNGKYYFNFHSDSSIRALTRAILKEDFQLDVDIPIGNLVPRVPSRLNYLLVIEDILVRNGLSSNIRGIDIGTGASCIYALLGAKKFGWNFIATDTCEASVACATRNVNNNFLQDKISVVKTSKHILKEVADAVNEVVTFSVCNPPFFEEQETSTRFCEQPENECILENDFDELMERNRKKEGPRSATTARRNELETQGGEVAFVSQMIVESILLKEKIKIYTSLLGKKRSLQILKKQLQKVEGVRFTTVTMQTGKTHRWILMWTFADVLLEESFLDIPLFNLPMRIKEPDPLEFAKQHLEKIGMTVQRIDDNMLSCKVQHSWEIPGRRKRRRRQGNDIKTFEPKQKIQRFPSNDTDIQTEDNSQELTGNFYTTAPHGNEEFPMYALNIRIVLAAGSSIRFYYLDGCRNLQNQLKIFMEKLLKQPLPTSTSF